MNWTELQITDKTGKSWVEDSGKPYVGKFRSEKPNATRESH
jgi:hypothetical protein